MPNQSRQITPRGFPRRPLWFDESDVKLLVDNLRRGFYRHFNKAYEVTASAAEHSLTFSLRRRLNPIHARHCMNYLGVHPKVIEVAIGIIERQKDSPPPKSTHVQYDLWFRLLQRISGKELLGHKTLTMTLRYAHLAPSHATHALSVLDEALTGSQLYKNYTIEKKRTQPVWLSP